MLFISGAHVVIGRPPTIPMSLKNWYLRSPYGERINKLDLGNAKKPYHFCFRRPFGDDMCRNRLDSRYAFGGPAFNIQDPTFYVGRSPTGVNSISAVRGAGTEAVQNTCVIKTSLQISHAVWQSKKCTLCHAHSLWHAVLGISSK